MEVSTDSGKEGSFSTDGTELRLYTQPTATSVAHPYGPATGGAVLWLKGSDFADAHSSTALFCQFVSPDSDFASELVPAVVAPGGGGRNASCTMPQLNAGEYPHPNANLTL